MKAFFWFCLALLVPGLLLRIPIGGAGILATDIVLPLFVCLWLFQKIIIERQVPSTKFLIPGVIFVGIAILSFLVGGKELNGTKELVLSFAYIVRLVSLLLFGWAAKDLFQTKQEQKTFFFWLGVIGTAVVILGFLQFFLIPDISGWSTEGGWDPHQGRLLGTWLDPNFMAGFISFLSPILIGKWYDSQEKKEKWILGIVILLFLGALFLTFSRSGYLSAAFGLFLFFAIRDPKVILIGILCVSLGIVSSERAQKRVGALLGTMSALIMDETVEIDPTANLRLKSWTQSLTLWEKNKTIGIGYNTYRYRAAEEGIVDENYFSSGGSDSTHLTVLITTGVLGIIPFLWLFGTFFIFPFQQYFKKREALFLGFSAGIGAIFVHGFFVNSLFFPFIFLPLIAIFGVLENKAQLK